LEASERSGGTIYTVEQNDCTLDAGPDSFITAKPWAEELCKELGLEDQLIPPNPEANKIFIVQKDHLRPLPKGLTLGIPTKLFPFLLNRSLPWSLKLRAASEFFYRPKNSLNPNSPDEALAHFIQRHFGREALDLVLEPILAGIYAGQAENLSTQATFPQLLTLEKKYGSLIRGFRKKARQISVPKKPIFLSLKKGMGHLIDTIEKKIPQKTVKFNHKVEKIEIHEKGRGYSVFCSNHQRFFTKQLILTLPPIFAKHLFSQQHELKNQLDCYPSVSTAVVFIGYPRSAVYNVNHGFGFISPRKEACKLLACSWVSNKFPMRSPRNTFLIRAFLGGAGREELAQLPEEELKILVDQEIRRIMKISSNPLFSRIFYWRKRSPQYPIGHPQNNKELAKTLKNFPGLYFIGNSYSGIGIPDCVRLAKEAAEKIITN